jgi:hypothetical protein
MKIYISLTGRSNKLGIKNEIVGGHCKSFYGVEVLNPVQKIAVSLRLL